MDKRIGQSAIGRDALLDAAALLINYSKAQGDHLYWADDHHSDPVKVIDLVGGFGSTLLGHNHPELLETAKQCLDSQRPVNAQGSHRQMAALLCETIADKLLHITGEAYQVLLYSTGTEAVEAALKHAEYEFSRRQIECANTFSNNVRSLKHLLETGNETTSEFFFRQCEHALQQEPIEDIEELLAAVTFRNQSVFNTHGHTAAFKGAFHGKTKGSLATTWNRDARLPFIRNNPKSVFIENSDDFKNTASQWQISYFDFEFSPLRLVTKKLNTLVAVIYEPIQGEAGIVELSKQNSDLLSYVKSHYPSTAIIADEIQCGLGRTGNFLESSARGLPNDYITFAKSLGGGLCKISAVAIRRSRYFEEFSMLHSSTFADDDFSSVIAKKALDIIERDNLALRCQQLGEVMIRDLGELQARWPDVIKDVRGKGCMIGIEFNDLSEHPSATIAGLFSEKMLAMIAAGFLLHRYNVRVLPSLGNRHVLRIQPSAYLPFELISSFVGAIDELCRLINAADSANLVGFLVGRKAEQLIYKSTLRHPERSQTTKKSANKIGFISHLIDKNSLNEIDPSLDQFDEYEIEELNQRILPVLTPGEIARRIVTSKTGKIVEFILYGIQMDAETIEEDMRFNQSRLIRQQVNTAYEMAREEGCTMVGFGGYNSIITSNCIDFKQNFPAVTSGNSLTVATSLTSILSAAQAHCIDIACATVVVCGAAGNIGKVHSALLAKACGKLILIGREGSAYNLENVSKEVAVTLVSDIEKDAHSGGALKQQAARFIGPMKNDFSSGTMVSQLSQYLLENDLIQIGNSMQLCALADIIVCSTNSAAPILDASHIATNKPVLISDIAVPRDVSPELEKHCPNAKVIRGGVVNLPYNPLFSLPGMLLDDGQIYACAAETILLGLSGVRSSFSIGTVDTTQVEEVQALAAIHGFELDKEKVSNVF